MPEMTARDRIRAAECEGCREMYEQAATNAEYLFHPPGECTAPTDGAMIERLAGEAESLTVDVCQCDSDLPGWICKHCYRNLEISKLDVYSV